MISIISSSNYKNNMQPFIDAGCDKSKAEKNYKRISQSPNLHVTGRPEFIDKVQKTIKEILELKPGRILFKKLMATNHQLTYEEGEHFFGDQNTGRVTLALESRQHFYCALNANGKRVLRIYRDHFKIFLIHESIHMLHDFQGKYNFDKKILDPEMDNLEEQITICGIDSSVEPYTYSELNENVFLALIDEPFRINHKGFPLEPGASPTLCDYFWSGAEGDLDFAKDYDLKTPQIINFTVRENENFFRFMKDRKILPLTAATCMGRKDLFLQLIEKGADIFAQDDIGGAIHGAVMFDRRELLEKLVELGVNINQRDAFDNTPLLKSIKFTTLAFSTCFEYLIRQSGVDFRAKDLEGRTALDLADKRAPKYCIDLKKVLGMPDEESYDIHLFRGPPLVDWEPKKGKDATSSDSDSEREDE